LARKTTEAGIGFLPKPFTIEQIMAIIDDYCATSRQRELERRAHIDDDFSPPIAAY